MARRPPWQEYFLLSRKERNGLLILLLVLMISCGVRFLRQLHTPETAEAWLAPVLVEGVSPAAEQAGAGHIRPEYTAHKRSINKRKDDPPESRSEAEARPEAWKRESPRQIEVNRADSEAFLTLPRIGPYFAGKLASYRDALGGFVGAHQLYEIWKMDSSTVEAIAPLLQIDTAAIRQLPFNSASWEEFDRHPYLNRRQAKALVAYREKHGPFRDPRDLAGCLALDTLTLRRIRPYFAPR